MENLLPNKKVLVAPLNWGLGHATRCIPIIKKLEQEGFDPVIASDGSSLSLLKNEFPHLQHVELPSYNIKYSINGKNLKWKIFAQLPKIFRTINKEHKEVSKIVQEQNIDGIISDNRPGVYSKTVPSVYITHQLNVLSQSFTAVSSKLHQLQIRNFKECWVPDCQSGNNLSGKLGHMKNPIRKLSYLGPISRLTEDASKAKKYDIGVVLSGPEPQRTLLEQKLKKEFRKYDKPTLFIKGIVENEQKITSKKNITYYNFMTSQQLGTALNECETIICRSGYSTIMDLACLQKKAYFIPTPGQDEQEYLAKRLKYYGYAPYCNQDEFTVERLEELNLYKGLINFAHQEETNWKKLFSLF